MSYKRGYCPNCGARIVCAHCFTCGFNNKDLMRESAEQELRSAIHGLIGAAERLANAEKIIKELR